MLVFVEECDAWSIMFTFYHDEWLWSNLLLFCTISQAIADVSSGCELVALSTVLRPRFLIYITFLCFLRDDPEEQSACLVEAYRLLRSTAYQLHLVMQQNFVVQDLVAFLSSCGVSIGSEAGGGGGGGWGSTS